MKMLTLHIALIGKRILQMIGSTIAESRKKDYGDECITINIDFLRQPTAMV